MPTRSPSSLDRSALAELLAPPSGSPFRPEEEACALELLDGVLTNPPGNTYEGLVLADDSDTPVAYACFGQTPMTEATYDLYWLVTAPSQRRRGLGRQLMAAVEQELRGRGARIVRIETSSLEGQGGARRFYESIGYEVVGTIIDFYRPGDDLITLARRL